MDDSWERLELYEAVNLVEELEAQLEEARRYEDAILFLQDSDIFLSKGSEVELRYSSPGDTSWRGVIITGDIMGAVESAMKNRRDGVKQSEG